VTGFEARDMISIPGLHKKKYIFDRNCGAAMAPTL
jgi:hypothetical protein